MAWAGGPTPLVLLGLLAAVVLYRRQHQTQRLDVAWGGVGASAGLGCGFGVSVV